MDSATEADKTVEKGQPVKLSPATAQVYEAIVSWFRDTGGAPPTMREIMRRCGHRSTSVVSYHIRRLADAGLVRLAPGASRSVMLTGARWVPPPPAMIEVLDETPGAPEQLRAYWSKEQRESRAARKAASEVAA